ncbi:hypothetical protein I3843_01G206500 [Carya illinoinensis]|nr:hypothetical protein I3843_01G206500 [Carya illinoinensis]
MGFLHKLWDETLAGPAPDTGLGKLRKYDSFSATRSPPMVANEVPITRSITILRSNSNFRNLSVDPGSAPESPAGPSNPESPLTPGTPGGDFRKLTRRKTPAGALEQAESRSPTAYDWFTLFYLLFRMTYMPLSYRSTENCPYTSLKLTFRYVTELSYYNFFKFLYI